MMGIGGFAIFGLNAKQVAAGGIFAALALVAVPAAHS
jgi:hypothetical protein